MALELKEEKTATQTRNRETHSPESAWWRPPLHLGACFGIAAVSVLAVIFLF